MGVYSSLMKTETLSLWERSMSTTLGRLGIERLDDFNGIGSDSRVFITESWLGKRAIKIYTEPLGVDLPISKVRYYQADTKKVQQVCQTQMNSVVIGGYMWDWDTNSIDSVGLVRVDNDFFVYTDSTAVERPSLSRLSESGKDNFYVEHMTDFEVAIRRANQFFRIYHYGLKVGLISVNVAPIFSQEHSRGKILITDIRSKVDNARERRNWNSWLSGKV